MNQVLIVRHGPGRGRAVPTLDPALAWLRTHDPDLFAALRFHATGDPPPDVSGVAAIWFWLADPLRESHPKCHADACLVAASAGPGVRLVNPPDALSNTVKSVQARIWRDADVPTPPHVAFDTRSAFEAIVGDLPLPALVRGDRLHSQQHLHVVRSAAEALALEDVALPGAAVPLVDTRVGFEAVRPGTVWARFFHKKRSIVFGDAVDRRSVLFSESPIVSLDTCIYRPFKRRRPWRPLRGWAKRCVEADNEWFAAGDEHDALLVRATRALGLTVAAIDYSTTADGRAVLWEANPYFFMPRADRYLLPRARRFPERRSAMFRALAGFLRTLACS